MTSATWSCVVIFLASGVFLLEALLMRILGVLGSSATADGGRLAANYAANLGSLPQKSRAARTSCVFRKNGTVVSLIPGHRFR